MPLSLPIGFHLRIFVAAARSAFMQIALFAPPSAPTARRPAPAPNAVRDAIGCQALMPATRRHALIADSTRCCCYAARAASRDAASHNTRRQQPPSHVMPPLDHQPVSRRRPPSRSCVRSKKWQRCGAATAKRKKKKKKKNYRYQVYCGRCEMRDAKPPIYVLYQAHAFFSSRRHALRPTAFTADTGAIFLSPATSPSAEHPPPPIAILATPTATPFR